MPIVRKPYSRKPYTAQEQRQFERAYLVIAKAYYAMESKYGVVAFDALTSLWASRNDARRDDKTALFSDAEAKK